MAGYSLIVKKSDIHGYGLFSITNILKGEIVLESPFIDVMGCSGDIQRYTFGNPKICSILPLDRVSLINSSNNPNVKWQVIEDKIVITTIRDIKEGEELFLKYIF